MAWLVAIVGGAMAAFVFLGWAPILMAANSEDMFISYYGGFFETVAFWATMQYLLFSIIITYRAFTKPDSDGLPPGFKVLAFFYRHPSEPTLRSAQAGGGQRGAKYMEAFRAMKNAPAGVFGRERAKVEQRRFEKLKEDTEAETERMRAAEELARANEDYERAKARKEAAERKAKNDERKP